ncbi:MAG: squalene/phytoene synthase family protein, partial [Pseudomonadota bacterium]
DGFSEHRPVAHPVVRELQRAVTEDGLNNHHLLRVLDARRRPLEDDEPPTLEDFEQHLHDIGGSIFCAAAELLGGSQPDVQAILNRAGLVSAALEHCRFLQDQAPGSNVWLPADWYIDEKGDAGTVSATVLKRRLADRSLKELAEARRQAGSIPRAVLPALFPITLAASRLRDPIGSGQPEPLPMAVPRLMWCWLRRRF